MIVPQPVVVNTQPAALVHVQALTVYATAVTAAVCVVWLPLPLLLAVLQVRHGSDCRVTACRRCATDSWQAACFSWPSSAFSSCHELSTKQESAAAHNSCSSPSFVPASLQQPGQPKVDAHRTRVSMRFVLPAGVLPEGLMLAVEQCKEEGAGTTTEAVASLLEGGQRSACPRAVLLPPTLSPWGHSGALT